MTSRARIVRVWEATPEIRCFALVPVDGPPAPFTPGAHLEVHLKGGLIRQYSLWNGPEDRDAYLIGVKREAHGRGGSVAMHELGVGDVLEIGVLRNNFEMAEGGGPPLLLAGGIGITPLLSMARQVAARGQPGALHLFARSAPQTPFLDLLTALPGAAVHLGLLPPALDRVVRGLLAAPDPQGHLYICGPGPFMDLVEREAILAGWPSSRVHLERFSIDPSRLDQSGGEFEVVLKRTGKTLRVAEGQTIIAAMEEAGITPMTSCEQGVCGTCLTTVLEGVPDHRDQYLNASEKALGTLIMPCVSRCKGARLVLDL